MLPKGILYFKFTLKMYFTNTKSNYFTYIKDIYLLPLRIILFRRQLRGARPDNPICERRVGIQYRYIHSFVLLLYYNKQSTFPSRKFSYGNFMISHSIWKNDLAKLMNMKHFLSGVAQAGLVWISFSTYWKISIHPFWRCLLRNTVALIWWSFLTVQDWSLLLQIG